MRKQAQKINETPRRVIPDPTDPYKDEDRRPDNEG